MTGIIVVPVTSGVAKMPSATMESVNVHMDGGTAMAIGVMGVNWIYSMTIKTAEPALWTAITEDGVIMGSVCANGISGIVMAHG